MVESAITLLSELRRRDIEDWTELAAAAVEPNPFYEPEPVLAAADAFAEARPALLAVRDADGMIACLPVTTGRWRGRLPALAGWRHIYAFLGTPLVREQRVEEGLMGLLGAAGGTGRRRLPLVLERVTADGAVGSTLRQAIDAGGGRCLLDVRGERALLKRRPADDYLTCIGAHHRRDLARLSRRLAEHLGGEVVAVDRAGEEAGIDAFLELESSGWKGRAGTAMRTRPGHGEFFGRVCRSFAASERLELLELVGNGRTVAMKCNLRAGEGAFAFKIAYDDELERYSPGIQLELANIAAFHASQISWMDSCAESDNEMINRLWPERRQLCSLVIGGSDAISTMAGIGLRIADRIRRAAR